MRSLVLEVIKDNPQVVVDAMGEGMSRKRDEEFKKLAKKIGENKNEIDKICMTFGKSASSKVVTCVLDPLCKHCVEFLKSMVKMVTAGHDVCFKLIPVAVLGPDSVMIAKIYAACYKKNSAGALKVINAIVSHQKEINMTVIKQILEKAGFNFSEIETDMTSADADIARNGEFAERIGIPLVPAIVVSTLDGEKFVQAVSVEQLQQEINGIDTTVAQAPQQQPAAEENDAAKEKHDTSPHDKSSD
jgi:protein-disulfide isomerase